MVNKVQVEHTYKSVWDKLSKIDCSEQVEKKMNLTYLSWAWAWGILMEHYPEATYEFYESENGIPYVQLPDGTAEVRCKVKIGELQREMWLAVMNHANKPINNPASTEVSNNKMRCLVKCLAMFGLGHYIYAGEDLPQDSETTTVVTKEEIAKAVTGKELKEIPKPKEELPKDDQDEGWANATVEAIKLTLVLPDTVEKLNGIFIANKIYISVLEEKHPAKYKEVLELFKTKKEEIKNV
jgi:hypothetical protein